jgi:transposase
MRKQFHLIAGGRLEWGMSNVLKVSLQETIRGLHEKRWSERRIARELGINRRTVNRYASKCTIVPAGSEGTIEPKCTIVPAGKTGGRQSQCEAFSEAIGGKVELGLSAQRIYQDLVEEHGFGGSYDAVKRYVGKFRKGQPVRVWRMECLPGEEMQVDFGLGAPIEDGPGGKSRRSWVLRAVLSCSRKGYSEAVLRQDGETFLRVLENAVRSFGGVPLMLNLDNLKAAVLKADWFDPELNPKLADFCRHYGMHVVPCRPRKPQHKGKVERGIGYVRNNALKGRRFKSLAAENLHLQHWEQNVADKRIHGTTCKQVAACFELERPHLQPLPASLFPCYQEARRSVNRDSYVEVAKSYYEAPPEYIGRQVWVRWDSRCVRIFNDRMEQVRIHTRIEPGKFTRHLGAGGFGAPVLASCRYWVTRAAVMGEPCGQWAQSAVDARGPEALRSVMALCGMLRKHSGAAINAACERALRSGTHRLKDVRRFLGEPMNQTDFGFAQSHPLIRDLKIYSEFINQPNPAQTSHHDPHTQTTSPEPPALGTAWQS